MRRTGARRIVFDAIDIMLALLPDHAARRREIYRLHDWLLEHRLTALITAKALGDEASATGKDSFGFMQFMVDCTVILSHRVILGVSQRNLRVQKYRGSTFNEDEAPFVIGATGFDVSIAPKFLQTELVAKKVEKTLLSRTTESRDKALTRGRIRMGELRGADVAIKERK
jgi:circadian clock protein KaiC